MAPGNEECNDSEERMNSLRIVSSVLPHLSHRGDASPMGFSAGVAGVEGGMGGCTEAPPKSFFQKLIVFVPFSFGLFSTGPHAPGR